MIEDRSYMRLCLRLKMLSYSKTMTLSTPHSSDAKEPMKMADECMVVIDDNS